MKIKRRLYVCCCLFLIFSFGKSAFSQKEGNIWYFGQFAGVDFNSGSPVALTNSAMNILEGGSSVSDSNGNLLFYTSGVYVHNANHALMPNGSGLMGNYSNTQCIIVKQPGHDSLYYIFTTDQQARAISPFGYSIVDMRMDGGLGDVAVKNVGLFNGVTEKVTAVQHENGAETWVITHDWNSDLFRAYLLSCDGLDTNYVASHVGMVYTGYNGRAIGYMKASPDRTKIACAVSGASLIELFDFDDSNGQLSNPILLPNIPGAYGVEFSPDGTKFYTNSRSNSSSYILQYDISSNSAPQILASRDTIDRDIGNQSRALQLGPDGIIYVTGFGYTYLSGITNPNALGSMAGHVDSLVYLNGQQSLLGLPHLFPIPPSNDFTFDTVCVGDTTFFLSNHHPIPDSINWEFGEPASGAWNFSNSLNPFHIYTNPGSFQVNLITYRGCVKDTVTKMVFVDGSAPIDLGTDSVFCDQTTISLDGGISSGPFLWSTGDTTSTISVSTAGLYWLEAGSGNCSARDSIQVAFGTSPIVDLGEDSTFCDQINFSLDAGNSGANYIWSNGATVQGISVGVTGLYWVEVSENGCTTNDSITLTFGSGPTINLGPDTSFCAGASYILDAGNSGASFDWSTGESSQVITAQDSGTYSVVVDAGGCIDSASVSLSFIPPLVFDLGADTSLCGDSILLSTGSTSSTHLWSTGQMTSSIWALDSGSYSVQVTGLCETLSDSIYIALGQLPIIMLGDTFQLCGREPEILQAGNAGSSYSWQQTFDGISWVEVGNESTYAVSQPGEYQLEVRNECGISNAKLWVEINQDTGYFMPNVFSPNGDQVNDVVKFEVENPQGFSLSIFDRWGRLMFQTQSPTVYWDGNFRENKAAEGVYFFTLSVRDCYGELVRKSGHLTLLR